MDTTSKGVESFGNIFNPMQQSGFKVVDGGDSSELD
jgi:hypothetical protein